MFRSILNSFARSYGRQMGRTAARRTNWIAIPMLILVVVLGVLEATGAGGSWREWLQMLPLHFVLA